MTIFWGLYCGEELETEAKREGGEGEGRLLSDCGSGGLSPQA